MDKLPSDIIRAAFRREGRLFDPFHAHAVVYMGTPENGVWEVGKTHHFYTEHTIPMDDEAFDRDNEGKTDAEIIDAYWEEFSETAREKLF